MTALLPPKQLWHGDANVAGDLPQKKRRDVPALVKRHGRDASVGVAKLLVRAALANLCKAKLLQELDDLTRFENRNRTHRLANGNLLQTDELTFEFGVTVLEQ